MQFTSQNVSETCSVYLCVLSSIITSVQKVFFQFILALEKYTEYTWSEKKNLVRDLGTKIILGDEEQRICTVTELIFLFHTLNIVRGREEHTQWFCIWEIPLEAATWTARLISPIQLGLRLLLFYFYYVQMKSVGVAQSHLSCPGFYFLVVIQCGRIQSLFLAINIVIGPESKRFTAPS